jgi:hypothetical protein
MSAALHPYYLLTIDDDDDDDDNKTVWPTWAVGALFRGRDVFTHQPLMFSHTRVIVELGQHHLYGQKAPA